MNISRTGRAPRDVALARVARRQHGVATAAQLRELGLNDSSVSHRVRVGRLHRLCWGVYAVGHAEVSWEARSLAGALSVGGDAVLSHWTAVRAWGLLDVRADVVEVTVARRVRSRRGIRVHTVRRLDARDRTTANRLPLTTVARTLVDLADVAGERVLIRAVREALVQRRVNERALREQLNRAAGRRGAPRLVALMASGPAPTRSVLEDRVLDLLRAYGFPPPEVNVALTGVPRRIEVDFLYPQARLIIEADGARYHENRLAREADVTRQAMLEAAGYRVMRVNWTQVTGAPDQTVNRLRRALAG